MYSQLLYSLIFALLAGSTLSAQSVVQISIADVIAPGGQTEICVPVVADSFPNIASMGFSLRWDSTQVRLQRVDFGANPLNINAGSTSMPDAASYVISYISEGLRGITLDSGTAIMNLCFAPVLDEGFTDIIWRGINPAEFVQEGEITAVSSMLNPGSITYGGNSALVVYPGDTNGDQQVDHRDALNIGITSGASGPERPNASTEFMMQSAPIWSQQTVSGVNYANIDTDGNGSIGLSDLQAVQRNYGRAVNSFVTPADISTNGAPVLKYVNTEATVQAGVMTSGTIELGDGNNPDAIGYGLSFTIDLDPNLVDMSSVEVQTADGFLGDVITYQRSSTNDGQVLVTLVRTDGNNTTTPGGTVATLSFIPLNTSTNPTDLTIRIIPNAFKRADQSDAPIGSEAAVIVIEGQVSVVEPAWGKELTVFPNPYTSGPLTVSGDVPAFDAVRVLSIDGRLLKNFRSNQRTLDLTELPTGTYLLQVEIGGEFVNRGVVKL